MSYSLELKDEDGKPTGKFFMDEAAAKQASAEVLSTNFGIKDVSDYMSKYWSKTWGHFDVNQTKMIVVEKMPLLVRFLGSDQYKSFQ